MKKKSRKQIKREKRTEIRRKEKKRIQGLNKNIKSRE